MKILLVLPAGAGVRVTRQNPEVPRRAMLRFSVLPLTMVAALTPRDHEVRIVDENVEPLEFDPPPDLVGISFMTALAPRAYEIAAEFRRRGTIVVGGGYHPTLCPEDAAPHFDALVLGDAEGCWQQLLWDVQAGTLQPHYAGSTFRAGELDVPVPRRELLQHTRRHYATIDAVQTGRGCRHACRYCSVTAFHRQTCRRRPVEQVIVELRGVGRTFIFVDDNLAGDRDYAVALFSALAPLQKRWVAQCSIEIGDDHELLRLAWQAGCRGLFIGIETNDPRNLALVDKAFNQSRSYRERIGWIRRQGIGVIAGMIAGLDADDRTVFERQLGFLQEHRIDAVQVNILTPLPGTPLFAQMKRDGRITDPDWSCYDFRHVVFRPLRMSAEELQAGADWLYAQFYRLDRILLRALRTLWTCGWQAAWLGLRLNLTYRYDNRREGIRGWNPAEGQSSWNSRAPSASATSCMPQSDAFSRKSASM